MGAMQAAEAVTQILPMALERRGLAPAIQRYVLVRGERSTWLFAVLDVLAIEKIERYTHPETIHQIKTVLSGMPVIVSNSNGLRYGILLSGAPTLPENVPAPEYHPSRLWLGVDRRAQAIGLDWDEMGHVLAAGMTRSGKTSFLRTLVDQAAAQGADLVLLDPDGRSFPYLAGRARIASTLDGCEALLEEALLEMGRRSALYGQAGADVDKLSIYNERAAEKLPRMLVVIDEFNGLATALGGPKGSLARAATRLAWGGLKFGIHLVLAGQDFTKDIVGPVRDQMATVLCFKVRGPMTSRVVLGKPGADNIKVQGRSLTNRWGLVQCYAPPPQAEALPAGDGLSAQERKIVEAAKEAGNRLTFAVLESLGIGRRDAERLRADWVQRGLVQPGGADNALILAQKLTN